MNLVYGVYVKTNQENFIIDVNSSAFITDLSDWIKIDEGSGDRYRHAQGNYFSKNIVSKNGVYQYELIDGVPRERASDEISAEEEKNDTAVELINTVKQQTESQTHRAIQLFAMTLPEETALEIPYVYDTWKPGKSYAANEYVIYGINSVGDPQLYRVAQAHTSQDDWIPVETSALYTSLGLNESGYPIWSQPISAQDAYDNGDIVDYNGTLYKSLIDGNVWSPDTYPDGWEIFVE